jgi:hypothetical protein
MEPTVFVVVVVPASQAQAASETPLPFAELLAPSVKPSLLKAVKVVLGLLLSASVAFDDK